MNDQHNTDAVDKVLRNLWLETADNFNDEDVNKAVNMILSSDYSVKMSDAKKKELLNKLYFIVESVSLGQLVHEAMLTSNLAEEDIAKQSQLPLKTFSEIRTDAIFPNNIPILLLRNLLKQLNISYKVAAKAILKSFDIMKNKEFISSYIAQPTFRRGQSTSRDSFIKVNHKVDGKELFENEDALNKYLSKLEELMK